MIGENHIPTPTRTSGSVEGFERFNWLNRPLIKDLFSVSSCVQLRTAWSLHYDFHSIFHVSWKASQMEENIMWAEDGTARYEAL